MTSYFGRPAPRQPSRSGKLNFFVPPIDDRRPASECPDWYSGTPTCQRLTNLRPHNTAPHQLPAHYIEQIFTRTDIQQAEYVFEAPNGKNSNVPAIIQVATPPVGNRPDLSVSRANTGGSLTSGQASLFDSLFSLAGGPSILSYAPENSGLGDDSETEWQNSIGPQQAESAIRRPKVLDDDIDANVPERILVGLLDGLVLDQEVESNILPFVAHSFTSWMSRFLFEPTRVISLCQDTIIRGHFDNKTLQRMILLANIVLVVSKSTEYELTHFMNLHKELVPRVKKTRIRRELTREEALAAMETCHEFISITTKVGSLANILRIMDLYAPVFRRACPEPGDILVNPPHKLTSIDLISVNLKYYATFDVLQSVLTNRPMFFRYDLNFLSRQDEVLLNADDGPGLRWSIGVPDLLVITLARMNTLLEDYGSRVDPKIIGEIEGEIRAWKPAISSCTEDDPSLVAGRVAVQESWRLVGYVYLYMALCGVDSSDARVRKVHKIYMRLLKAVKPRRIPDSFLIFPMTVLGVATPPEDRPTLLARLWGVSECNKSGTVGNDVVRILNDIWAHTADRPAVWSDLRIACLKVTGM